MVSPGEDSALEIARLEGQVAALERLLAERSRLLRELSLELCPNDLVNLSRLASGLPPLAQSAFGLNEWRETTQLTSADVQRTMDQLWRSLAGRTAADE